MIWQIPKAAKKAISVICVDAVEALRLAAIVGSAGRYMSIAKGPTAVSRPRTIAFLAKDDSLMTIPFDPRRWAARHGRTCSGPSTQFGCGQALKIARHHGAQTNAGHSPWDGRNKSGHDGGRYP